MNVWEALDDRRCHSSGGRNENQASWSENSCCELDACVNRELWGVMRPAPRNQTSCSGRFMIVQHLYGGWRREHDLSVPNHCDSSGPTSLPRKCEVFELGIDNRSRRFATVPT